MLIRVIRYEINPTRPDLFKDYAQNRDQAIPPCGAGLIGSFALQEGSSTLASGICTTPSLAKLTAQGWRLIPLAGAPTISPGPTASSGASSAPS